MSEDKKNPAVKEKGLDKSSCDSKQPSSCDHEDKNKESQKVNLQPAKKDTAQQNTSHKHGGNCSH